MRRVFVSLDRLEDVRYFASTQLPGVLIINTNAKPGTVSKLHRLGVLSDDAIEFLMRKICEPQKKALQRGNAERAQEHNPLYYTPKGAPHVN